MNKEKNKRGGKIVLVFLSVEGKIPHPFYDADKLRLIDRMLDEKPLEKVIEDYPFGDDNDEM